VTVIAAEADFVVSATEVAVIVTPAGAGTPEGAVYVTAVPLGVLAGETVPQAGEQFVPPCVKDQETPPLLASLEMVAVNCCVVPTKTLAVAGETETEMGGVTVSVAVADFVESATDDAVSVT
jgi:hypothetical protein